MVYEMDLGHTGSSKETFPEIELGGQLRIKTF